MRLLLALEFIVLVVLYFRSRSGYNDLKDINDEEKSVWVIMLPVASFISDRLIYGRFNSYERKLGSRLAELDGIRGIKHRLRLHLARKTANLALAILAATFIAIFMGKLDISYMVFAAIICMLSFYYPDQELSERIKKRNFSIQYEFPDFLNKLVLLVNAGMTVHRAWEKIVQDRKVMTPLYKELNTTYLEIKNGKPEIVAYEDFARRCRVKEITRFIAAVIQNMRKGNSELVILLKLQSNECWQLRKNIARRLGEEASTKLVIPLMIMFVGILIIVILPAIMQLRLL
ncbi:MAG TPA: type II secretion system F family protein [Negativicutes bacterium]|nr:type II secretion system F family protein [Negativicutes bacterium]